MKIIILCLGIISSTLSFANKGLEIAKKVDKANEGFIGETSDMKMVLINAQGDKIIRKLRTKVMEVPSDGDKSLSIFLLPKDVEGTKMLTWTHKKEDDDQWLFMPSLKRVKRIHSNSKTASFMGSEFSYEDLGSQEVEKYNYKFLSENKNEWVIERTPITKESGYSKHIVTISKKYMNPTKVDYYNTRKELLKSSNLSGYKKYSVKDKNIYRPQKIHMVNVLTKKESILEWKDRKIGKKLKASEFKKEGLNDSF